MDPLSVSNLQHIRNIIFLKFKKFSIPKHIWAPGPWKRDCVSVASIHGVAEGDKNQFIQVKR